MIATHEKYKAKFVEFPGQAHNLTLEPAWQQVADSIDRWISQEVALP